MQNFAAAAEFYRDLKFYAAPFVATEFYRNAEFCLAAKF